jgi:ATP-binding cassette subfamily B (MDR/TAP) protein 1
VINDGTTPDHFLIYTSVYIIYLFVGRLVLAYIAIVSDTWAVLPALLSDSIEFGFRLTSLSISAAIRLDYLQCLFRQPISTLDALPSGQTAAIITITANILQLGISERLSSLIQAIAVIVVALIIGCIYSWELTLVTACGLVLIVCWYSVLTPVIVKKQTTVQQAEREAMNVVGDALLGVRMIAACGAESKTMARYNKLIDRAELLSQNMSPLLAIQHAPGQFSTILSRDLN